MLLLPENSRNHTAVFEQEGAYFYGLRKLNGIKEIIGFSNGMKQKFFGSDDGFEKRKSCKIRKKGVR